MKIRTEVIDNFLAPEHFEQIRDLLTGCNFPWHFQREMTYPGVPPPNDEFYFTHVFFIHNTVNSALYQAIAPLIDALGVKALMRAKANLYPNLNRFIVNAAHTDYDFQHQGAVYYINTNNGYTMLEDGTKVESIANRVLLFEADKMHSSTHCTDQQTRVNINLNYF